ncbi:ATP-grasp domain-containing protein [Streptomyces doebereineriae]|uniref:ATP-grasp domain-containing protein n=1 Tax=Streptomyces doebereineriae TaxID=3075528 RepID=A0ABU2VRD6_9ACTN|nr:ATP-grasp domain-containing protein [Streptomyces sp. DSM 41640]MDT0488183.1 ATP-grasp domain-containing protein [Streptomyces sp. DSM 41640]
MPENWPQGALIVLGASEEQIPLYPEARRRQIPTIAVDMRSDAPAFPFADATLTISTRDTDAITDALGDIRPAGIVCGASDAALASWHTLALHYGTAYVYPGSALAAGDKAAFHEIAASCGITGYGWTASDNPDEVVTKATQLRFPIMVKPVDGSGSKGVTHVTHPDHLPAAVACARSHSASRTVIAEEFVPGRPLAIEVFMHNGRAVMACIKDKEFVGGGFVVKRLRTAQLPSATRERIEATVERLCRALGITDGPANFDAVLGTDGHARIIEANARLGGDGVPRLLTAAYGVHVVRALIALALGEPFGEHLAPTRAAHAALELIGSPLTVKGELIAWEGVAEARNLPGITDVELYAQPGDLVRPHDQSGHKIGLIVAAGATAADASAALDAATALIRPVIRPTEDTQ